MPRPSRADESGGLYRSRNRGNARMAIFWKDEDYVAYEQILSGAEKGAGPNATKLSRKLSLLRALRRLERAIAQTMTS